MATEVWFRNPRAYIREIVEVRHPFIAWDKGLLAKFRIDPVKFCDLYIPPDQHYRQLVIGDPGQGCAEVRRGGDLRSPEAVYPVWSSEESTLNELEELIQFPTGNDPDACENPSLESSIRPVLGQEHRIILTDLPSLGTGLGRKMVKELHEMQLEYPDCIFHLHATYSFRAVFGMAFRAGDIDGRTQASKGSVYLGNGKAINWKQAQRFSQWVTMLGWKPAELEVPRNRCMFTMQSALWASKYYNENERFKSRGKHDPDVESPDNKLVLPRTVSNRSTPLPYKPGDKFTCDTCSVATQCKFYREGAVCSVPGAEPKKMADLFRTRDSDSIIEGMGSLLGRQAERLEESLEDEQFGESLDPEVSKLMNSVFNNAAKLAKLTNPELAGGTKVGVFVNGGQGSSVAVGSSASQLTASVIRQLESQGVAREDITTQMVAEVLSGHVPQAQLPAVGVEDAIIEEGD